MAFESRISFSPDPEVEEPQQAVDGSCGLARVLSSSSSLSGLDEPLNEDEPDDFPETAEEVVRRLRERLGRQVMRDVTPEGQYKRNEALQAMCAYLSIKLEAKRLLEEELRRRRQRVKGWVHMSGDDDGGGGVLGSLARKTGERLSRWKEVAEEYYWWVARLLRRGVWWSRGEQIRKIEGLYGTGVGTYFVFLRFLVVLNLCIAFISFTFLSVPQILDRAFVNGTFESTGAVEYNDSAEVVDFLTGAGWLGATELYYGAYSPGDINVFSTNESASVFGLTYDMPTAYFYTMTVNYIFILVVISVSMARSFRRNFIETHSDDYFSNRVFCGWDYGIVRKNLAQLKAESIRTQIKESLEKQAEAAESASEMSVATKACLGVKNVVVNLAVVLFLVGVGFLTAYIMDEYGMADDDDVWSLMALSLAVSPLILFVPFAFSLVVRLESFYSSRTRLYLTLARSICLQAVILWAIAGKIISDMNDSHAEEDGVCRENLIGEEMYRLLVSFALVVLLGGLALETARNLAFRLLRLRVLGAPEFDVARGVTHLVYAQSVCWMGLYFSPLLPIVLAVVFTLTYLAKKFSLRVNCRHSRRPWRTAQSETVYKLFAFLSFLAAAIIFFYVITAVHPSTSCGPYQNYSSANEVVQDSSAYTFFLFQPAWVALLIVALSVCIYYIRTMGVARKRLAIILRRRIQAEGMEKALIAKLVGRDRTD